MLEPTPKKFEWAKHPRLPKVPVERTGSPMTEQLLVAGANTGAGGNGSVTSTNDQDAV